MGVEEPTFDDSYLPNLWPHFDSGGRTSNQEQQHGDLQTHVEDLTRTQCRGECENAVAQLKGGVVDYLLSLFTQIAPKFLPAPIWQSSGSSRKTKDLDVVSRSLRISAAARLALASNVGPSEQPLQAKVEGVYKAARNYIDSISFAEDSADVESILLLAELEYGRGKLRSAKARIRRLSQASAAASKY